MNRSTEQNAFLLCLKKNYVVVAVSHIQRIDCQPEKATLQEKAKAKLRYTTVVCPNVTRRAKERIAQSKRVRAGSMAIVD